MLSSDVWTRDGSSTGTAGTAQSQRSRTCTSEHDDWSPWQKRKGNRLAGGVDGCWSELQGKGSKRAETHAIRSDTDPLSTVKLRTDVGLPMQDCSPSEPIQTRIAVISCR